MNVMGENKLKISLINITASKYGGNNYETGIAYLMASDFTIDYTNIGNTKYKSFKAAVALWRLLKLAKNTNTLAIRNFETLILLNKKNINIAIVHHIDNSYSTLKVKFFHFFFKWLFLRNMRKCDLVVTVSNYWKRQLEGLGYKNVHVIFNAFDVASFEFRPEEIMAFKENYKLCDKPIVYIGNAIESKGVLDVYNVLKDLDVHLVTSGVPQIQIPALNLNLDYRDYQRLLRASSVAIVMSKFNEGWCRIAHEAMLCKTPVIGSGKGGMQELLDGGKQITCGDIHQLKATVSDLLSDPVKRETIGMLGYDFAKTFTADKFKVEWINVIHQVLSNRRTLRRSSKYC